MAKLSIRDTDLKGKRVVVRVDYNVPVDDSLRITDDTRIVESAPTINHLRAEGAKIVLLAHFGRPKGQPVDKYSLKPVAEHLKKVFGGNVGFSSATTGSEAVAATNALEEGDILLMENVRFNPGEEKNDEDFAKELAELGELYVNDAFGAAHRAHASTAGMAAHLPEAAMGFLMEKELKYLQDELEEPKRPFLVILGGAKVSDKIGVIKRLMDRADTIMIGGAMAYTFLKAQGYEIGNSRVEADKLDLALELIDYAKEKNVRLLLPVDAVETQEFKAGANCRNTALFDEAAKTAITPDWEGVDIGEATRKAYAEEISKAATVVWNGPVGVFEIEDFANGTKAVANALAESGALSIIGGGDSVTAVKKFGLGEKMTFLSTGGGASLELLEGKELPGVAALSEK